MKNNYTFLICMSLLFFLISCQKEEDLNAGDIIGLGGDTWTQTEIDQWIYDSLTKPYNIQVKYKFDAFESDVSKTLVPPKEELVIPLMRTMKKNFFQPYIDVAGENFIKGLDPKEFMLYGSPSYNNNGSITLGEAEGGKTILLYEVNNFDPNDKEKIRRIIRTTEHEFGHILQQHVEQPVDFNQVTKADYTGDWTNQSQSTAYSLGFITPYSMSAYNEDFVEMIATMLTEGKLRYEAILAQADALSTAAGLPSAAAKLRQKEAFVVNYYREVWGIDFYQLQQKVQDALNTITPDPATNYYGANKWFTTFNAFGRNDQPSTVFKDIYTRTYDSLRIKQNYYLDSIIISRPYNDTTLMRLRFLNSSGSSFYNANFRFKTTVSSTGTLSFGPVIIQSSRGTLESNANFIKGSVTTLTDYLSANTWQPQWPNNANNPVTTGTTVQAVLTNMNNKSSYILGYLSK